MNLFAKNSFEPQTFENKPNADDYEKVKTFINFTKSLSEIIYQSLYIIDYYKKDFLYVSGSPIFLCGCEPEDVLREGYSFYLKHVPKEDMMLLLKINEVGFSFFKGLKKEDRLKYTVSYDFHLKQPTGRLCLLNHKLKPVFLDRTGNVWIALCIVSISSNSKSGNISFNSKELKKHFEFNIEKSQWEGGTEVKLNLREKEILLLSAQGLTMKSIADRLFLSIDTIKFHKKNIFLKLRVKSISEAIAAAMNRGVI